MFDLIYRFDTSGRYAGTCPTDAAAARERLEAGNKVFAKFLTPGEDQTRVIEVDGTALVPTTAGERPPHRPFAAVLGCADARVPTELVLGQATNDLFVVRVAGNVLGAECLGSLDYAVTALDDCLRLLVVLGHSGCGAVTAAADVFMEPNRYHQFAHTQSLRAVVDRVLIAVRSAHYALELVYTQQVEERPGYREALIETAVVLNAAMQAATLRQEFRDRLGPHREVVYGVYDLLSRRVKLALEPDDGLSIHLATPPADAAGFDALGLLVAGSGVVRGLIGEKS